MNNSTDAFKIEIGCGISPRKGYKSCDIRDLPGVDYVCSAHQLPFENNSVDEIYTRHVIEHFSLKEFLEVLQEWNRVLKTDGIVYMICPNLLYHCEQMLKYPHESFYTKTRGENQRYWGMGSLFGWQQNEYDIHKFGYYFELLRDILTDFGFDQIDDLTNKEGSVENAPWHLEVKASKRKEAKSFTESKFFHILDVVH
ncbi:MAG: methyltransferase domain-containing protein [Chitinophagaceae bacterium]